MTFEFDGYRPGSLAAIVGLHARYYAENWDFGLPFEAKVAGELAEFLSRMTPDKDLYLIAYRDGAVAGSIVVDASGGGPKGAHMRWFIVCDAARGCGLGKQLMQRAMDFCHTRNHNRIWLTTFSGLNAARALYERHGFVLTRESDEDQWQGGVREQLFEYHDVPQGHAITA